LAQAVGSADLAVVVVVVDLVVAHSDHVTGSVVVVFLEAEALVVVPHAPHVSAVVVLLEAETLVEV